MASAPKSLAGIGQPTTSYGSTLAEMNRASTPTQAATIFSQQYERPEVPMLPTRQSYAQSAYTAAGY